MKLFRKSEGCSKERIQQALEENIQIEALIDNSNLMMGISPLFQHGIIHDIDLCPSCILIFELKMLINWTCQFVHVDATISSSHLYIQPMILKPYSELSMRDWEPSIPPSRDPKRKCGLEKKLQWSLDTVISFKACLILTIFCRDISYLKKNPLPPS